MFLVYVNLCINTMLRWLFFFFFLTNEAIENTDLDLAKKVRTENYNCFLKLLLTVEVEAVSVISCCTGCYFRRCNVSAEKQMIDLSKCL